MRLAPLLALLLSTAAAQTAPTPGACAPGTAEATITPGFVEAVVFNTGALFGGNGHFSDGYLVPRRDGNLAVGSAGLWVSGVVGGELRGAAPTYTNFAFWPGPLGPGGTAPADCAPYDRIYRVSRQDVAEYLRTGLATADLRDWPAALGAPVLDGDGVAGNYNLAGGDQPALRGDDVAWWLMNDAGNVHQDQLRSPPLGLEARVEAYGFQDAPLNTTTFYHYTLTNGTTATLDSLYVGLWAEVLLDDGVDQYVGSDSLAGLTYGYNADNVNGGAGYGYGVAPPAIGLQVARGPVALPNGRDDDRDGVADEPGERSGATAAPMFFRYANALEVPRTPRELARKLQGLANDGTPVRAYGSGYNQTQGAVTRYAYPGDPVAGTPWSEVNTGTTPPTNSPGFRRVVIATGPFRLAPGVSDTLTFAIPYARGTSNLNSVTRLRTLASSIRTLFSSEDIQPRRVLPGSAPPAPIVSQDIRLSRPFPNPTSGRATVTYEMPAGTRLRATLHDVLGRELAVLADGPTAADAGELTIDGARLAPGVYRVRVVVPAGEQMLQFVVTR